MSQIFSNAGKPFCVSNAVCRTLTMGLAPPGSLIVEVAGGRDLSQYSHSHHSMARYHTLPSHGSGTDKKNKRERCGRYSLNRVLQQWENLKTRCRLTVNGYNEDRRDRYQFIGPGNKPPSLDYVDNISIGKQTDQNGKQSGSQDKTGDQFESCCPIVHEIISPLFGRNRSGHLVELYKSSSFQQTFYEHRCQNDVRDQPCRFVGNNRKISKCVQQYMDSYALIKSHNSHSGWIMDHIRVGSGCACQVDSALAKSNKDRRRKLVSTSSRKPNFFWDPSFPYSNGGVSRRRSFIQWQPFQRDF